jgi:hypothetical protein
MCRLAVPQQLQVKRNTDVRNTRNMLLAAAFAMPSAAPALAQQRQTERQVEQYQCKDVMRDSGTARDIALAFLHGYLLGKSGGSSFNLDAIRKQNEAFVERCLMAPTERAVDAMAAVRK